MLCSTDADYGVPLDPFSATFKTSRMETLFSVQKLPGPAGFLTVNSWHPPEVTLFGADLRGCPGTRAEAADLGPGVSGCRPPGLLWGGTPGPLAAADRPAQIGTRRRRPNAAPPTQCPPPLQIPMSAHGEKAPPPPQPPTDAHGSDPGSPPALSAGSGRCAAACARSPHPPPVQRSCCAHAAACLRPSVWCNRMAFLLPF